MVEEQAGAASKLHQLALTRRQLVIPAQVAEQLGPEAEEVLSAGAAAVERPQPPESDPSLEGAQTML
jgi:hypothetical protein